MIINYSKIISDKIIPYIESKGFTVVNFSDEIPKDVAGQIRYDKKEIHTNVGSAEGAMYTLIHEVGHMLSYFDLFVGQNKSQNEVGDREVLAFEYGWKFIQ